MSHTNKYRLAAAEAQERLHELSQGNASDLRDEVSLCRLLLEEAAGQQSPATIPLMQTLAKLSSVDLQNRIRTHDMLTRDEALRFVQEVCSIVSDEIQSLDGFENVLERIAERLENKAPQLEYDDAS